MNDHFHTTQRLGTQSPLKWPLLVLPIGHLLQPYESADLLFLPGEARVSADGIKYLLL